jgi:hypothetical protein
MSSKGDFPLANFLCARILSYYANQTGISMATNLLLYVQCKLDGDSHKMYSTFDWPGFAYLSTRIQRLLQDKEKPLPVAYSSTYKPLMMFIFSDKLSR